MKPERDNWSCIGTAFSDKANVKVLAVRKKNRLAHNCYMELMLRTFSNGIWTSMLITRGTSHLDGLKLYAWTRKRLINMGLLFNTAHDLGAVKK